MTDGTIHQQTGRSKPIVVLDLDNTIIDTAHRKRAIVAFVKGIPIKSIHLAQIRRDYQLKTFLRDSGPKRSFKKIFGSEQGIRCYPAPAFKGASAAITALSKKLRVCIVTARAVALRSATKEELRTIGLAPKSVTLIMKDSRKSDVRFKTETLRCLTKDGPVLMMVGDRPDDVTAACKARIPIILFSSTTTAEEHGSLRCTDSAGFCVCDKWSDVRDRIRKVLRARRMPMI